MYVCGTVCVSVCVYVCECVYACGTVCVWCVCKKCVNCVSVKCLNMKIQKLELKSKLLDTKTGFALAPTKKSGLHKFAPPRGHIWVLN